MVILKVFDNIIEKSLESYYVRSKYDACNI